MPIISQRKCKWYYERPGAITDKEICTFDAYQEKYGSDGDSGGPLVVHNRLIGIMSWSGTDRNQENPDVFMKVSHPLFRNWIVSNVRIIEG